MSRKRLGELLTDLGLIDATLLRTALIKQRSWNKRLGETLVEMGVLSDRQLAGVLSGQLNMPAVDLSNRSIDSRLAHKLGEDFCRRNECLPFAYHEKGCFVDLAMANPLNLELFEQVRVRMQCNPRPYVIGPVALRNAFIGVFGTSGTDSRIPTTEFEEVGITGEIVLEVGSQDRLQAVQPGMSMPSLDIDVEEPPAASTEMANRTPGHRAAPPARMPSKSSDTVTLDDLSRDLRELRQIVIQTHHRLDQLIKVVEALTIQGLPRGKV